jgi:prolipoprotein diacylglyceryltransferase
MKWYCIHPWKSVAITILLVLTGAVGSQVWYFVENLRFGGRSFYGAVFLSPLVFYPVSKLLRIPYGKTMDFVAPAGCFTLALVKIQCLHDRCCEGIVLGVNEDLLYVLFPSQIVEMIAFLLISVILFVMAYNPKNRKQIFLWFLVFYGGSRFILDFFRSHTGSYALGLSAGSFWSLLAFLIGGGMLLYVNRDRVKMWIDAKRNRSAQSQ